MTAHSDVVSQLADTRMLTLTGVGGCAKMRLALEVARSLIGIFRDSLVSQPGRGSHCGPVGRHLIRHSSTHGELLPRGATIPLSSIALGAIATFVVKSVGSRKNGGLRLWASAGLLLVFLSAGFRAATAQIQMPSPPTDVELLAAHDLSITISWDASPGATGYNIYRATSPGLEGTTPIANTDGTAYKDAHLSAGPIYFYQVTAVNAAGESPRTPEDASTTPPPVGTGGNVPGIPSGNSIVYYGGDALLDGFDWFQQLTGWFPQVLGSSGSISPGQLVTDMAYSPRGTMTFNNVVVPTSGLYTVDWRYAFDSDAFPGITNRQMGLRVNGEVITNTERFIITGSFDVYQHSFLKVNLNAGVNSITLFAVSNHGVARVDQMTITPATASVPSEPTNLTATATPCPSSATLTWTPSVSGNPTSYSVYRGNISDGEDVTPIGATTDATTWFTDANVQSGTTYFYSVVDSSGLRVDSAICMTPTWWCRELPI